MPRSGDTFIGGLVNWFSSDIVRINSLNFLNALMVNNSLKNKPSNGGTFHFGTRTKRNLLRLVLELFFIFPYLKELVTF